ncbi:MAG TPA: CGNR zinc finger domain-containing protein [Gemmatimonadales bacterium]|nr:CGNR zinc finger domain-containing protein [Gemmatimonadales bacterium]
MSDPEFILLGDAVWIDFVNTARGRQPDPPDGLPDAAAYHRWTKAQKLASDASEVPWDEVLAFRARLLAIAAALAEERQPPSAAIHEVNRLLARSEGHHQLTRVGGAWQLAFAPRRNPSALVAIAASAAATLADAGARVHQCQAEPCSLYFVDRSPDHSRTWCSAEPAAHPVRVDRRRAFR